MAERSVVVRLRAEVDQYVASMERAAAATDKVSNATGQRAASAAQKQKAALQQVGQAATLAGAATVAGVGLAVKAYADFDKQMSSVQAATHETEANMSALRDAAVEAGAETAYSAIEAATGIEELAKAGISTKDILGGGLNGALSLAAAGSLDVGKAAELAATAMTQFGLSGEDIPHIADLLAAGAGKAQGSVEDMGMALKQAGLVADQTGLTIEETTGGLAAFASAGLVGSDAGTAFKSMLQRLTPTSKEASDLMADLGVSAYDAQGNFIGLSEFAGNLSTSMANLTVEERNAAMATIFGSDAVRAAAVLYENGAAGVQKWEDAVNSAGFAAQTAAIKQDNLAGDLEKLGGAFDTVFLQAGSGAGEALRGVVQNVEGMVDAIGRIPEPMLSAGASILGVAGGATLVAGGLMKVVPAALDTASAFRSLGTEGSKIPGTMGRITKGAGAAAAAVAGLQIVGTVFSRDDVTSLEEYSNAIMSVADAGAEAKAADLNSVFSEFGTFAGMETVSGINGMADAIERFSNKTLGDGVQDALSPVSDFLNLPPGPWIELQEKIGGIGDAMGELAANGGATAAAESFKLLTEQFEANGKSAQEALDAMPGYKDALDGIGQAAGVALAPHELLELAAGKIPARMMEAQKATELAGAQYGTYTDATGEAAVITEDMAKRLEELGITADGLVGSLDKYLEALTAAGLATMSSRDAAFGWENSLRDMDGAIQEVLATQGELGPALNDMATDFNTATDSGDAANEMWQGLITTGLDVAKTYSGDVSKSQADVVAQLQSTYDAAVKSAEGFGLGATEAANLAREALQIPPGVSIETWFSDQAILMAAETTGAVNAIPKDVQVRTAMSAAAMETAGMTKKAVDDVPGEAMVTTWMSDAAFQEALRTRAASLNIPEEETIASFMSSAARNEADNTTSSVLGIPRGASVTAFMEAYIRDMANQSKASLDAIDGRRINTYADFWETTHKQVIVTEKNERVGVGQVGLRAGGGRLPSTGPGTSTTDGILGISSITGAPTTWVDAGEWIINAKRSSEYDRELSQINAGTFPKLPGYADGGRLQSVGGRTGREYSPTGNGAGVAQVVQQHTHHHTHVSADPGLGYEYAASMAAIGEQRARDMAAAYGNRRP